MARGDTSWLQEDTSWLRMTVHGSEYVIRMESLNALKLVNLQAFLLEVASKSQIRFPA